MAPSVKISKPIERHDVGDTSAPLADYFFISGIESSQVYDERTQPAPPTTSVEDTIAEDETIDTKQNGRPGTPGSPTENGKRRS